MISRNYVICFPNMGFYSRSQSHLSLPLTFRMFLLCYYYYYSPVGPFGPREVQSMLFWWVGLSLRPHLFPSCLHQTKLFRTIFLFPSYQFPIRNLLSTALFFALKVPGIFDEIITTWNIPYILENNGSVSSLKHNGA